MVARAFGNAPGIRTAPDRRGGLLATLPELDPADGRRAGRLAAADCTPEVVERLSAHVRAQLATAPPLPAGRLLDASPRNALMIPFLLAAFADAKFVYVHRRPVDALTESLEMWRAGSAVTYPDLPGWTGPAWSFLLVPGWPELIGCPLEEVVTEQWVRTMRVLTSDLESLPADTWCVTDHDRLLANPGAELGRLCQFLGVEPRAGDAGARLATAVRSRLAAADVRAARQRLAPYLARTEALAAVARDWIAGERY